MTFVGIYSLAHMKVVCVIGFLFRWDHRIVFGNNTLLYNVISVH